MEEIQIKINTLNALLPQQVPFVVQQVTAALKLIENEDNYERALDIAIQVAEQVDKFSQGDILYNYTPILLALLQFAPEDADLSVFDTVNHDIPLGVAQVKQYVNNYSQRVKHAPEDFVALMGNENICMVVLASLWFDIKEGKNVLSIAYIMMSLNLSNIQVPNTAFQFYCNILSEINEREF